MRQVKIIDCEHVEGTANEINKIERQACCYFHEFKTIYQGNKSRVVALVEHQSGECELIELNRIRFSDRKEPEINPTEVKVASISQKKISEVLKEVVDEIKKPVKKKVAKKPEPAKVKTPVKKAKKKKVVKKIAKKKKKKAKR